MDDRYFMKTALRLARKGEGYASPNPLVGAILVKEGRIVGKGYHQRHGAPHAEVNAIQNAGRLAKESTLYVNLEPCNHFGKTPPCTQAIIEAQIKRVVVAMKDPNPEVKGKGIPFLEARGVSVTLGVCEDEAKRLNEAFIKHCVTKRPFVTAKCAATLDGRIATKNGDSKWISNEKSRRFVHQLRHASDAVMVGINTILRDDPLLTTRMSGKRGSDPVRIILDTHLSIPETARVLRAESESDTLIVIGNRDRFDANQIEKKAKIEQGRNRILQAPTKNNRIDLNALMTILGKQGISSILLEGGSRVFGSALSDDIIDKIILFFGPKLLGGDDGIPICRGVGPESMSQSIPVNHVRCRRFGEDIMIEGYIHPPGPLTFESTFNKQAT
ncbi:MAG: bifunctional diaminohydroxyphosphoribosylaminopyrimidine deaminase/5-amino-6-(5-phosphoribosylamino)uracil reductase RibD [Thermodesulfobacteriota bacterium]